MPRDPLDWLDDELRTLDERGLRRRLVERAGAQGPVVRVDGRELINFASNDYLSLAADPRVTAAAIRAIETCGWGAGASPLISGHTALHAELERRLAEFLGTEAALVFSSGYAANTGTLAALAGRGDRIFAELDNHASLIDACHLAKAEFIVYPHNSVEAVESQLRSHLGRNARRRLIVTDSLFSMHGDVATLAELADVAERNEALLMIDEAHATGVLGERGTGAAELAGVADRVHVRMGTLSKALGSAGGFVAGSRRLIDWLTQRARSYFFSTAHPPALCAATIAALDIVRDEPWRRTELLASARGLRDQLRSDGWNVGQSTTQIIPVILGDAARTMRVSAALRELGFWAPGIRPPSVAPRSVHAPHQPDGRPHAGAYRRAVRGAQARGRVNVRSRQSPRLTRFKPSELPRGEFARLSAGQMGNAHQVFVDRAGSLAPFVDRPHDQRLTAAHVASREHALDRGHEVGVTLDVAAGVQRQS